MTDEETVVEEEEEEEEMTDEETVVEEEEEEEISEEVEEEILEEESGLSIIYPNPFTDFINIQGAENTLVDIYDINGRLLMNKVLGVEKETIDLSNLSSGVYYVITVMESKTSIFKIVKL